MKGLLYPAPLHRSTLGKWSIIEIAPLSLSLVPPNIRTMTRDLTTDSNRLIREEEGMDGEINTNLARTNFLHEIFHLPVSSNRYITGWNIRDAGRGVYAAYTRHDKGPR